MLANVLPSILSCALLCGAPSAAGGGTGMWTVGDELLTLCLEQDSNGAISESCRSAGVEIPYRGAPGALQFEEEGWLELGRVTAVAEEPAGQGDYLSRLVLDGAVPGAHWTLAYERTGPGRVTKSLVVISDTETLLERVAPASFTAGPDLETASTGLQDIAVFLRNDDRGLFISLDFPYSRIATEEGRTRVTYPAFVSLAPGESYACHSLTLGATQLTGDSRYGRDTGEVDAIDAYVQERFPERFERPMFVSACIVNRYTMPTGGVIWYTYKDHPTLSFHTDLMKREFELMPRLGMEYYQVFPGVFDWVPDDPDRDTVRELVAFANKNSVRVGDYSGCNAVFCGHYNEYGKGLDQPDWRMRDVEENMGGFCFGCPDFVKYYTDTVVPNADAFNFELHCMDFLGIGPCYAQDHGHPPGPDSVYHQVKGLVQFMEALGGVDPDMMIWSNSGNWVEFLPKLAWWNPNLYLTDPFIATPWQGLNMTRLLDDARREQMVSLHYSRFLPYRHYTNCQYFFSQNSIVPDIRNYQYGALSSIAVTPNLCLAEIRPWLDRLPAAEQAEVEGFYSRWTKFLQDHFHLWKHTYHVGSNPGPGGVEVYAHAEGDHGFIFVVNPNYWSETIEVPLDARLGLRGEGHCELKELYPVERLVLTSGGPLPVFGSMVAVEARAQEVRVFEVRPAPDRLHGPRIYGVPGELEKAGEGYVLRTSGPQGSTQRFAVRHVEGQPPLTKAEVRLDVPKQAKRLFAETPLRFLGQDGPFSLYELTFRRTPAPSELRAWRVREADASQNDEAVLGKGFEDGEVHRFPLFSRVEGAAPPLSYGNLRAAGMGPLANFCGAYIDNAFSEDQETWIDFRPGDGPVPATSAVSGVETTPVHAAPAAAQRTETSWWLRTDFHLPFMYTIGAEPAFDEHTIVVFPMLDPSQVKELRAWINGVPLEVRRYLYPRNRGLFTFWADLVGSSAHGGENTLVLSVVFMD